MGGRVRRREGLGKRREGLGEERRGSAHLARAVYTAGGVGKVPRDRAHIHYVPLAALEHARQEGPAHGHGAHDVGLEHRYDVRYAVGVGGAHAERQAGVVDEHAHGGKLGVGEMRGQGHDGVGVGHVEGDKKDFALWVVLVNVVPHCLEATGTTPHQNQLGLLVCKPVRTSLADSSPRACN